MSENLELVLVGAQESPWYGWDHSGWYWAMGAHGIIWLALLTLIVAATMVLARSKRRGLSNPARSALDTRYARGELDRGEYLERKRDLA